MRQEELISKKFYTGIEMRILFNAFLKITKYSFYAYLLLIIASYAISLLAIDQKIRPMLNKVLASNGCVYISNSKIANPLDVLEFSLNISYWTADHKISHKILNDSKCTHILLKIVSDYKKSISIVFVDDEGKYLYISN